MSKLNVVTFSVLALAVGVSVLAPMYADHEKQQAMERMAAIEAQEKERRSQPSVIACDDNGVAWLTVYSSGFPTRGAIWAEKPKDMDSVVKCEAEGYSLEGVAMSEQEVLMLAVKSGLEKELGPRESGKRGNAGFPTVDMAAITALKGGSQ